MSIDAFTLMLPLTKIDEERRLVFARAGHEIKDKSGEIMDYATAKPQFQSWSDSYAARTNGLSKGNVRAMHNKQHASGKVVDLNFNDDDQAIDVCMKIVDENDWQKCLTGVYTGVSVGGGYAKKWKDGSGRYTPIVRELSLVDDPCIPTAVFAELVKINGDVEQLQLRGVVRTFADMWGSRPVAPPTFAEAWDARPKTFGELNKAYPVVPRSTPNYTQMIVNRLRTGKPTTDIAPKTLYFKKQAPDGPKTFGELHKAFDESKHARADDGKFSGDGAQPAAQPEGYHMGLIGRLYDIKRRAQGLGMGAVAGAAAGARFGRTAEGKITGMVAGGLAGAYLGEKAAGAYSRAVESNPITRTISRLSVIG